jgi:hypothetical protein
MLVFKYNKMLWWSIREQVRTYVADNWSRWEEEKPAWFNDKWRAKLDDDMRAGLGGGGGEAEEGAGGGAGGGGASKVKPTQVAPDASKAGAGS